MPTWIEPELMALAMSCVALRPDEQNRFSEYAAAVLGKPAARAAARSLYAALPSETWRDYAKERRLVSLSRTGDWGRAARRRKERTHITHADIIHQGGIQLGLFPHLLQKRVDQVLERGVLEASLLGLGKRCPHGKGDDDIVIILGRAFGDNDVLAGRFGCAGCGQSSTHMAESALPGVRCLRMEPRRSAAILSVLGNGSCDVKDEEQLGRRCDRCLWNENSCSTLLETRLWYQICWAGGESAGIVVAKRAREPRPRAGPEVPPRPTKLWGLLYPRLMLPRHACWRRTTAIPLAAVLG